MNETPAPRKYYLHDGEQQTGPFSLQDLAEKSLTSTTMVWHKGMDDWQEAGTLEELRTVIAGNAAFPAILEEEEVLPPPFKRNKTVNKTDSTTPITLHPPHPMRSGFLKFIIVLALLIISGAAIHTVQQYRINRITMDGTDSTAVAPTYEEQILSIEDQEKAAPKKFLKASGEIKKTMFGGNFKIDGTITNTATVAKFKNVTLEVSFYTDKNKHLGAERHTIEESILPGSSKEFKLKIDAPKGTDNCKWRVINAVAF